MPGTPFPEYDFHEGDDDAATAAGDPVEAEAIRQSLANTLHGWLSGAGRAPGDLARESTRLLSEQGWEYLDVETEPSAKTNPPVLSVDLGQEPGKQVQKWADVAMWQAPEHTDPQKPKVTVSMCTPDPLGVMAMVNAQYTGRNLTSPGQTTVAERRAAWEAATVSRLSETPLEWIQWSINFENVSRAFTHQLVRTRMATYAQESQRFAVKDNVHDAVKLPPSLAGTRPWAKFVEDCGAEGVDPERNADNAQYQRNIWDNALQVIATAYANLVDGGMPAEDARGLLPTNMLTRVHMRVDMKTLLNLAGMRLCTQAQFEWRAVFAELAKEIRAYGRLMGNEAWQFDLIADSFRPVCYAANRCTMKAKSDRHCSIRAQVDAFEAAGIPSNGWHSDGWVDADRNPLQGISPYQWLADPTAARKAPGQEQ